MIKTHRVKLNLTKSQFELVREKQMESANCWNYIVSLSKEYYFVHKQWIKKNYIQKLIKGKYNLHSQTIQAISDKFDANRRTISELRKKGNNKAKYPYKTKKFYVIPFKASAINTNTKGNLKLSMSKGRYLELDFNHQESPYFSYGECVNIYALIHSSIEIEEAKEFANNFGVKHIV